MLSRLALTNAVKAKQRGELSTIIRTISTSTPMKKFGEYHVYNDRNLKDTPADYKEFPERDLVNFPHVDQPLYPPKIRLGFLPDSWFQFFYNKTGVTGPYVLGAVFLNFVLCKEYFILNEAAVGIVPLWTWIYILHQLGKQPVAAYFERNVENNENNKLEWKKNYYDKLISQAGEISDHFKNNQVSGPMYFQALRENYYLTMEAEYRRRVDEYKKKLQRKLDYFVDMEEAKRAYQRKHMVDWVVQHVRDNITDQVQKAALAQCVSNLKTLSQKTKL